MLSPLQCDHHAGRSERIEEDAAQLLDIVLLEGIVACPAKRGSERACGDGLARRQLQPCEEACELQRDAVLRRSVHRLPTVLEGEHGLTHFLYKVQSLKKRGQVAGAAFICNASKVLSSRSLMVPATRAALTSCQR